MATVNAGNSLRRSAKHHSYGSQAIALYREAASQTFVQGAVLKVSSGLVTEAGTGSQDAEAPYVGIAAEAGQNVTTKPVTRVHPCPPGEIFDGILGNSGDDLYVLADNRADIGKYAALLKDGTNGGWYLNASTASTTIPANARVAIVGVVDETQPLTGNTKVNPRVYFCFLVQGENNAANAALPRTTIYS